MNRSYLIRIKMITSCGGLDLANSQTPTQLLAPFSPSAEQGEKVIRTVRKLVGQDKTGRLLINYEHG